MSDEWIVLRTSGRSTLALAKSLSDDGFEVWTPVRTQTIRVPRMNVKREIRLPMLPSFVFARARHLVDLLHLAQSLTTAHRAFSVFHYQDRIPMIADQHLQPLRLSEVRAIPKKDAPTFGQGAGVRVTSGAFEGLKGRVERCKSGYALVIFTDWRRPVNIPTFLLAEDAAINSGKPARLKAA